MLSTKRLLPCLIVASSIVLTVQASADGKPCGFDRSSLTFTGSASEQARCLLRPVGIRAETLDPTLATLPAPLDALIGTKVAITKSALERYLASNQIAVADVGGALEGSVSSTEDNFPAEYFVIHDTSTPNYKKEPFPADIDANTAVNDLSAFGDKAHLYINRSGASAAKHDLSVPWRATKFELKVLGEASKGRFLHFELTQPRRSDTAGGAGNDNLAPKPGFTEPQLRRLAVAYVVASFRRGEWMIPAYHGVIDAGLVDGHDDPQQFDLGAWTTQLQAVIAAIGQ